MKLYFTPGACSLAAHIILLEAGVEATMVRVDLDTRKLPSGQDYLAVNPMGYVPALRLDDGSVLTETSAILQYIADLVPERKLAPASGSRARYRLMELLNFIATELHKAYCPLFDSDCPAGTREYVMRDRRAFDHALSLIGGGGFLLGDQFTVADAYLYVMFRLAEFGGMEGITEQPAIAAYVQRVEQRPAVRRALKAEGLIGGLVAQD